MSNKFDPDPNPDETARQLSRIMQTAHERTELEARIAELERVLRMVESDDIGQCLWCRVDIKYHAHSDDCPRQKVLGES